MAEPSTSPDTGGPHPDTGGPLDIRDEPFEPDTTVSDVVYDGMVWDIRRDTFDYNGTSMTREYVQHPGAAAIVAMDHDGRVLLIQQYRHPVRRRDWEIPAGLLDVEGESPLETARRELAEEADLDAASWEPLVSAFTTPGGNDEIIHIFLATGLSSRPVAFARHGEEADMRIEWVPLREAITAVVAGRLHNGILALGLLTAAEHLRRARAGT